MTSSVKTYRVHVSALGCAGITVDRLSCSDHSRKQQSPPPPQDVRVVAILSRNGRTLGITPLSSPLRQTPTKGQVSQLSRHRFLALWTEADTPSTISFTINLHENEKEDLKNVKSTAFSRLTSRDFDLYLGVAWEGQSPIPFAAANLSLKAGMPSKMYDLPLYSTSDDCSEVFHPSGITHFEEKKEEEDVGFLHAPSPISQSTYGIDSLDALLRVQITVEGCPPQTPMSAKHSEQKQHIVDVLSVVAKGCATPTTCMPNNPAATSEADGDSEAKQPSKQMPLPVPMYILGKTISKSKQGEGVGGRGSSHGVARPKAAQGSDWLTQAAQALPWIGPLDDTSSRSDISSPSNDIDTRLSRKHGKDSGASAGGSEESETLKDGIDDEASLDDNTMETDDCSEISQETLPAFQLHLKKIEQFVESITIPNCKTFERMVKLSTDDDEGTSRDTVNAGTENDACANSLSPSQCGALDPLRNWLKSCDNSNEADHDEFCSIISQHMGGTNVYGKPGPVQSSSATRSAMYSSSKVRKPHNRKSTTTRETDDGTRDDKFNSYPVDEISCAQDATTFDGSVNQMTQESSDSSDEEDFLDSPTGATNVIESTCTAIFPEHVTDERGMGTTIANQRKLMLCTDAEAVDYAMTELIPNPDIAPANMSASVDDSPDQADLPGLMGGNLSNLCDVQRLSTLPPSGQSRSRDIPVHRLSCFPDPDGDYSTVGDPTLMSLERRVESEGRSYGLHHQLALLRERSRIALAAQRSSFSSIFATKSYVESKETTGEDVPFDEADQFVLKGKSDAFSPDLSAAAGLAWAKQRAEREHRRYPARVYV